MWILKRLHELGVSIDDLLMTYLSRVRVYLEQNVPLWHFSITKILIKKIENIQKASLYIILGKLASPDYFCNLAMLNLQPLINRREILCKKFAKKTLKHPVHSKMFKFNHGRGTRSGRNVIVPPTKSARYENSSIPSLAKLINSI